MPTHTTGDGVAVGREMSVGSGVGVDISMGVSIGLTVGIVGTMVGLIVGVGVDIRIFPRNTKGKYTKQSYSGPCACARVTITSNANISEVMNSIQLGFFVLISFRLFIRVPIGDDISNYLF